MGTCTGFGSSCNAAGVALETWCHLGQTVKYDTITQLGCSANVMHHWHGITGVGVLAREDIDWARNRINKSVPVPAPETDCVVWVFILVDNLSLHLSYIRRMRSSDPALT